MDVDLTDHYEAHRQTERLGTKSLISNLGIFIIYGIGLTLTALFIIVSSCRSTKDGAKINTCTNALRKKFFCNGFLRFLIQATLKMQIAAGAVLALYYS